jgi:GGDEF domain-containing protein/ActR/RegA family two-component response regulator
METAATRVLTASERDAIHVTVARALTLAGAKDVELLRADAANETLAIATAEQPRVVFLDVTLGDGAGLGLVHFLPSIVPGLTVVAIVPDGQSDARLVEQAASLGAAWVLLGELTGDDVLRAFGRVTGTQRRSASTPPAAPPPVDDAPEPSPLSLQSFAGPVLEGVDSVVELDLVLAELEGRGAPPRDARAFYGELRAALSRAVTHERSTRAAIQDVATSAYSFSYFVDLAGREIDLARRHGRRFALATVDLVAPELAVPDAIEVVLAAVRDTDVVARADERELLLLLPETGSKGARALRRRVLDRLASHLGRSLAYDRDTPDFRAPSSRSGARPPHGNSVPAHMGIAAFPFDGEDLSRLLRIARRRAERWAPWDTSTASQSLLSDALAWLSRSHRPGALPKEGVGPLVPLEVPLREGWALFDTVVRESTRGGDATIAVHAPHDATEPSLGLAQGIRAATLEAMGPVSTSGPVPPRSEREKDVLSLVSGVSRLAAEAPFAGLEVVAVLAEHAVHALVGRIEEGRLVALHGHDLPIAEALVSGLEQPVFRRGSISGAPSSAAPGSGRGSRSDAFGLRRTGGP